MAFRARQLVGDGLYTFAFQSLTVLASFALGVLTARVLGPAGKGVSVLPIVQAGLVSAGYSGLSSATSYYLLNERAGRGILTPLAIVSVLFVVASAAAVTLVAYLSGALWAAPAAIASLPATAALFAVRGYVTGIKRVRTVSSLSVANILATLVVTAAGFLIFSRTPWTAILAWVVSTTLVGAAAWIAMIVHARGLEAGKTVNKRAFLWFAAKGAATALVTLLNYRAGLFLVAIMLPPVELGLYSIAASAPQVLLFPAQVTSIIASPHVGGLEKGAAAALTTRCVRHTVLVSGVICAIMFFVAPPVVRVFYGANFLPMVPALRILLFGVIALSLAGPISNYYTLKLAKPEVSLLLSGVSAVLCIIGTILLVPHFGIVGAAVASSGAYIVAQAVSLWYFTRATGTSLKSMLVPTALDLRAYLEVTRDLQRDFGRMLRRRVGANG